MREHCCPWWLAYTFDNPLRRLFQKPEVILAPYVQAGMTVLDLGAGMGFYSIAMAKMVGASGKVFSVDVQSLMLSILEKRARAKGVFASISPHLATPAELGIKIRADFALAMWMAHEVPDLPGFLTQVRANLKPTGKFMIVEPKGHVKPAAFARTIQIAEAVGFKALTRPRVGLSHAAVLGA